MQIPPAINSTLRIGGKLPHFRLHVILIIALEGDVVGLLGPGQLRCKKQEKESGKEYKTARYLCINFRNRKDIYKR
jgi:hypothetical protein